MVALFCHKENFIHAPHKRDYALFMIRQYNIVLTQTDAVLGKRAKWSELYSSYSERHFVKFDNEMQPNF
jgi:hypothetical protein